MSHADVLPGPAAFVATGVYCKDGQFHLLVTGGYNYAAQEVATARVFHAADLTHTDVPDRPEAILPLTTGECVGTFANCDVLTVSTYTDDGYGPPDYFVYSKRCYRFARATQTWEAFADFPYTDNAGHFLSFGLPDGSFVVASPFGKPAYMDIPPNDWCYRWDPSDGLWHGLSFPLSDSGPLGSSGVTGCLLSDGRYLAVGHPYVSGALSQDHLRWSIFDGTSWSSVVAEAYHFTPPYPYCAPIGGPNVMALEDGKALVLLAYNNLVSGAGKLIGMRAFLFDGVSTWTSVAVPSIARELHGTAGSYAGEAFVVGGTIDGDVDTDTIERFDSATETWSTLADTLARPARYVSAVVVPNGAGPGRLYCLGGYDGTDSLEDVLICDVLPTSGVGVCNCGGPPVATIRGATITALEVV